MKKAAKSQGKERLLWKRCLIKSRSFRCIVKKICFKAKPLETNVSFSRFLSSGGSRPSDKGGGGGGGGAVIPDPEIRGGPVSKKTFSALRASVWSKNKGGRVPRALPLDSPLFSTSLCTLCFPQDHSSLTPPLPF